LETTAATLLPSAEQAMACQFLVGALVCVQACAHSGRGRKQAMASQQNRLVRSVITYTLPGILQRTTVRLAAHDFDWIDMRIFFLGRTRVSA
jgi:hypothetical protein